MANTLKYVQVGATKHVKTQENIALQSRFLGFLKKSPHPTAPRVTMSAGMGRCGPVCHSPRPPPLRGRGPRRPGSPRSARLDPGEVRVTLPGPAGRQLSEWGSRVLRPPHLDAAPAPVASWSWLLNLSPLISEKGVVMRGGLVGSVLSGVGSPLCVRLTVAGRPGGQAERAPAGGGGQRPHPPLPHPGSPCRLMLARSLPPPRPGRSREEPRPAPARTAGHAHGVPPPHHRPPAAAPQPRHRGAAQGAGHQAPPGQVRRLREAWCPSPRQASPGGARRGQRPGSTP